jgi:hypothetical protein
VEKVSEPVCVVGYFFLVTLTDTWRACGIGNFFTSTVTLSGLNSDKIASAMSAASFSMSFQHRPRRISAAVA